MNYIDDILKNQYILTKKGYILVIFGKVIYNVKIKERDKEMYYEKRRGFSYSAALILILLAIIIVILLTLLKRVDNNWNYEKQEIKLTGTDTIKEEFNLQDMAKNTSYSIVRNFKTE